MPEKNDSPVGISEASRILGVSEQALRQWTDEGAINSFLTPGGHRRYSLSELKRFMGVHAKAPGLKELTGRLEDSIDIHREIAVHFLESIEWYNRLDKDSQQKFSGLGRTMLTLIIRAISDPSRRDTTFHEIRGIGRDFGEMTRELGLPLVEALQAFIRHRDPIVTVTTEFLRKNETLNRRITGAIPLIDRAMDEALLALVAAHQSFTPPINPTDTAGH